MMENFWEKDPKKKKKNAGKYYFWSFSDDFKSHLSRDS